MHKIIIFLQGSYVASPPNWENLQFHIVRSIRDEMVVIKVKNLDHKEAEKKFAFQITATSVAVTEAYWLTHW